MSSTSHIPGKENTLADAESRKSRKEAEWTLDREIFQKAIKKLHVEPQIDLFASWLNYQLIPFVAYQPENMARKKSKERPEEPLGTMSYQTTS